MYREMSEEKVIEEEIGKITDVPAGSKKMFEVQGRKILVINDKGKLYAINGLCSHYNFPLDKGIYVNGRIRCPLHGACFNVCNGDIEDYPGFDSLNTFEVFEKNGALVLKTTEKALKGGDRRIQRFSKSNVCNNSPIVVIGGGISAASFVENARVNGVENPIEVISMDTYLPYDRVIVSKAPFKKPEEAILRNEEFYKERNIKFHLESKVECIDESSNSVKLTNGKVINYGKLVIASGGVPRKLNVVGCDLKGIHYVRSLSDGNSIAQSYEQKNVVCIGSSFIGMEIASALAAKAQSVTIVSQTDEPLFMLGSDVGKAVRMRFETKGIKFQLSTTAKQINGENGSVKSILLENGAELPADIVIIGIGIVPATEFLKKTSVKLDDRGYIFVDENFRTNVPNIYGIGDVVRFPLKYLNIPSINIQHFQVAQTHGLYLSHTIIEKQPPEPLIPYFWTLFFFEFGLKFAGNSSGFEKEYTVGDVSKLDFQRFYFKANTCIACLTAGQSTAAPQFAEIFKHNIKVTYDDILKSSDDEWTKYLGQVKK